MEQRLAVIANYVRAVCADNIDDIHSPMESGTILGDVFGQVLAACSYDPTKQERARQAFEAAVQEWLKP